MNTSSSRAVVLLPTYNERENIERIVPAILEAAPVDIMVLDDNSPDGTGTLAQDMTAQESRVRVVQRHEKLGLGAAYLDGFRRALSAGYDRILEMDADFSHPADVLPKLLKITDSADVALGSRWVEGGGTENWPWHRRFISRAGSFYARTLLDVPIRDLTGGFKCFRREVLENIPLHEVRSTGYAFQIELTYRALRLGYSVVETPIIFVEREQGVSKMSRRIVVEAVLRVPQLRWLV